MDEAQKPANESAYPSSGGAAAAGADSHGRLDLLADPSGDPLGDPARRQLRYDLPSVLAEKERQSSRLLLLVVRSVFFVLLVTVTVLTIASERDSVSEFGFSTVFGLIVAATAVGVIVLVIDAMTPNKRLSTVVGVYIGVCFGLIGAVAIGALIDVIADAWEVDTRPVDDRTSLRSSELLIAISAMQREAQALRRAATAVDRAIEPPASDATPPSEGAASESSGGAESTPFDLAASPADSLPLLPMTMPSPSRAEPSRAALYLGLTKVLIGIILCYLSVSVVLTTKDDFRLVIPYVEFAKQVRGVRPLLVDTSALIDGRINDLGQTGFFDAPIIVPRFVIDELQTLADSSDRLKRSRGRRGLDMVAKLQSNPYLDVTIDDPIVEGLSVDKMLIELARTQKLRILTTDYNLKKVAHIHGVAVLNVNDLANTLKAAVAPGEALEVQIVKVGENPSQGVGYLPDGTMVVIEEGAERIGETVSATVTNSLQTSAGRMIFAKTDPPEPGSVASMARVATAQPRAVDRPGSPRRDGPSQGRNPRR